MLPAASKAAALSRLAWGYFALVMLAYGAVLFGAQQPPPTVDYPDWVYQGVLFHGVLTGHPVAGYALKRYPVPNSLTTVALGLLDCILPWAWAAKAWVGIYLALAFAASRNLTRASGATDWQMIVALPTVAFLNLDFWWGHISFEIGLCLLLVLVSLLLRKASSAAVGLLLLLLFFTHMEACACGMLLLGVWTARDRRWKQLGAVVPVAVMTAWYAVGRYGSGNVDGLSVLPGTYRWGSKAFVLFRINAFFKALGYVHVRSVNGRSVTEALFGRTVFCGLLVAGCGVAVLCFFLALRCDRGGWRGSLRQMFLWLIGLAVLLPQMTLGVADASSRLLLVGVVLVSFAVRWKGRAGTLAATLCAVLCGANLVQLARVEAAPHLQGAVKDLPAAALAFGHVEPAASVKLYEMLARGQMDARVFETGIFRMTHARR